MSLKIEYVINCYVNRVSLGLEYTSSWMMTFKWGGMVFNATFNNISVISWLSILLVEETEVPRENHRPFTSH